MCHGRQLGVLGGLVVMMLTQIVKDKGMIPLEVQLFCLVRIHIYCPIMGFISILFVWSEAWRQVFPNGGEYYSRQLGSLSGLVFMILAWFAWDWDLIPSWGTDLFCPSEPTVTHAYLCTDTNRQSHLRVQHLLHILIIIYFLHSNGKYDVTGRHCEQGFFSRIDPRHVSVHSPMPPHNNELSLFIKLFMMW